MLRTNKCSGCPMLAAAFLIDGLEWSTYWASEQSESATGILHLLRLLRVSKQTCFTSAIVTNNKNQFADTRTKLSSTALPSLHHPSDAKKITIKSGCCIKGCLTKKAIHLEKFPPKGYATSAKWIHILGIPVDDFRKINSLRICRKHFVRKEFVTGRYLVLSKESFPSNKQNLPLYKVQVVQL